MLASRARLTSGTLRALPGMVMRLLFMVASSSFCCSISCLRSLSGVRTKAMTLYCLDLSAMVRQAFATPPVAPKKRTVWLISVVIGTDSAVDFSLAAQH